jgi:fructose-1,6-bisphosphatase/inositol monophosphatase family enzyme
MDVVIERPFQQLVLPAGRETAKKFHQAGTKYTNPDIVDPVMQAELAADRPIVIGISREYPEDRFISEERLVTAPNSGSV